MFLLSREEHENNLQLSVGFTGDTLSYRTCAGNLYVSVAKPRDWRRDFSGRVLGISDGDAIRVMHDWKGEKIRLYGIDAPEKGQAIGNRAKQFISSLAFGKEVKAEAKGQDHYGRTVADVILPDGRSLNREIVKAGFAW